MSPILQKSCYFLANPVEQNGTSTKHEVDGFWWVEDFVNILQASVVEENIAYHIPSFWILVISKFHMKLFTLLSLQGRKSLLCVVIVSHIFFSGYMPSY